MARAMLEIEFVIEPEDIELGGDTEGRGAAAAAAAAAAAVVNDPAAGAMFGGALGKATIAGDGAMGRDMELAALDTALSSAAPAVP